MSNRIRYMYLRDENRQPVGCVAIKLHRDDEYLEYQLSVVNPADRQHPVTGKSVRFNRDMARELALGRLTVSSLETFHVYGINANSNMNKISTLVMDDLARHGREYGIPTRAIKAAKLWLNNR